MAKFVLCLALVIVPAASWTWPWAEKEEKIPNVVYVTGPRDVMSDHMHALWKKNARHLDGAEVRYYNDAATFEAVHEISALLEKEAGIYGAEKAFHNLRPGAYRADLWRIMMLWAKGGIYLDCDLELQAPIKSWLTHSNSTLFLVQDAIPVEGKKGLAYAYWNAMMASTPRHKVLEHIIKTIVSLIKGHYYADPKSPGKELALTGPRALAMALESYKGSMESISQAARLVQAKNAKGKEDPYVQLDNKTLVKHDREAGLERDYEVTSPHYAALWELHLVFCDEGDLPCSDATQRYYAREHPKMQEMQRALSQSPERMLANHSSGGAADVDKCGALPYVTLMMVAALAHLSFA